MFHFLILLSVPIILVASVQSNSENSSTVINSSKIKSVSSVGSEKVLPHVTTASPSVQNEEFCQKKDYIAISRDPNDCDKYYVSCIFNMSLEFSNRTETEIPISIPHKTQSRRCKETFRFDQIEHKCLPYQQVDCSEFKCPESSNGTLQLLADTKRAEFFIECQGIVPRRQECQPAGTIFDEDSHTCVKAPLDSEHFSISLLRTVIRFMKMTKSMSPWVEVVQLNSTGPSVSVQKTSNASSDGELYVDSIDEPPSLVLNDSYAYVDDEMEVFTQDTKYVVLYYFVVAVVALSYVVIYLCISGILGKIFVRKIDKVGVDEPLDDEYYRYNQNDKYLMTRL